MATFATGGFHGTRYIRETDFGVTPPSPVMSGFRHTSNSLVLSKDSFQSNELRDDAQISDLRHGNRRVAGDIGIEFSYGEYDEILAALLRSDWVADKLVTGTTMRSYTFERVFNDIQQYEVFTGCGINTFKLTVQTNAMVTGTVSIVGKNVSFNTVPLDPDPVPSQTASPFDGFRGSLLEGGVPIAVITSIELTVDNGIEPAFVIGSDSAQATMPGRINITGTISAYFENTDLLNKFVNETESSLQFTLGDGTKQSYVFTLPRIKYSGGDNPVDGEGPVTLSMPFQGLLDECTGTSMQIERIPGPAAAPCVMAYDSTTFTIGADNKSIDNTINITLSGGDGSKNFNGFTGDEIPGVSWTGVPTGMTGSAKKVNGTTAAITLIGEADSIITAPSVQVAFTASSVSFGYCRCPGGTITDSTKVITLA